MAQEELLDTLMQFKHLDDCRVLFALLKHVEYENRISVSQADISRLLSMAAPQVNRAIKRFRVEVGQSYLAAEMGLTRQSVWLSFQRLQAQNILRKERKHGVDLFYLNEDIGRKVARMVEVPSEEESEEERELNESFALAAKYKREEERMKSARITGVLSNPFAVEPEETEDLE